LFWQLGKGSFADADEATHAEIAREMVASGVWITPHWNGFPFHDKPPLVMWFMAAGMTIIRSLELAARLPSALGGLLVIFMTALLGRSLFCTWTGLTAATLLLVSSKVDQVNFVLLARQAMLDVPLTGFSLWAFLHFWLGIRKPQHWLLMGIPFGLAILTKSFMVITVVFVVLAFVPLLALMGQPSSRQHWRYAAGGLLVALAISLPWHLAQLLMYGHDFFEGYVVLHLMNTPNTGSPIYYLNIIRAAVPHLAWVAVPAVCFTAWRGMRLRDQGALLLLIWLAVPLLFFSLIHNKLAWYIVPLQPALALAIALLFRAAVPRHWIPETLALTALILFTALWNVQVLKPVDRSPDVKALGDCVVHITPAHEQIAYYDAIATPGTSDLRPLWNIRPSVRVYANRPMIRVRDPGQLEEWAKQGGRFVWSYQFVADQIPASYILIAQVGEQRYYRHNDGSSFEANCSSY
jgi:4-amino-4-deoxy-L-arabinose transferase-like glycosyltransferase